MIRSQYKNIMMLDSDVNIYKHVPKSMTKIFFGYILVRNRHKHTIHFKEKTILAWNKS